MRYFELPADMQWIEMNISSIWRAKSIRIDSPSESIRIDYSHIYFPRIFLRLFVVELWANMHQTDEWRYDLITLITDVTAHVGDAGHRTPSLY